MNATPYTEPFLPSAPDPKAVRRNFSRIGFAFLVLTVVTTASSLLLQILLLSFVPDLPSRWWATWLISILPLYGFGLPFFLLTLRAVPVAPFNRLYHRKGQTPAEKPPFTIGHWFLLLVVALGLMYIGNFIGSGIMLILSHVTGYDYANALEAIVNQSPVWATFIGVCICAPLGEEFIFRKLLIDRTRRFGDTASIFLSAFLFALFHGNLFQFFYAFLLGVILAYIYTLSGKLRYTVAMHAVVNLIGGIIMPALQKFLPATPGAVPTGIVPLLVNLFLMAWIYGLSLAAIILIAVRFHTVKVSRGTAPLIFRHAASLVMINPGMLCSFIVMTLSLSVNLLPMA